ncbi:TGS domain-containing protein [Sinorhizobium meliloti]|uniref:TGS domain-containing protein n=1 Tax=Rhizobium meliloti TaxID=382 RepID=UPI000FDCBBBB|nr:TGS domain-containing protein [Sinorhizobium meliloti]RVK79384.1 TGS domain-containing protein [Sinorhizobium meliloti]RVQ76361.1 TGS domain-containing protein [Sinorhizobium meliloti]
MINSTNSTLLKMARLAYAVMKDKDTPFHLRREASEALIEFDVCDLIFTKEAKATISAINGLMKLSDKPGEFVAVANGDKYAEPKSAKAETATEIPKHTVFLTFPDGSIRSFPGGVTGIDVAKSISKTLACRIVGVSLNGKIIPASDILESGKIEIICSGDPRVMVVASGVDSNGLPWIVESLDEAEPATETPAEDLLAKAPKSGLTAAEAANVIRRVLAVAEGKTAKTTVHRKISRIKVAARTFAFLTEQLDEQGITYDKATVAELVTELFQQLPSQTEAE